ncbi:MAG TPA: hypothetical protein VNQ90_06325 [Chthoniobacteraceae bacterium]|nr:hypothetical protein [Chthoniobacteraceae bacterium]
MLLWDFLKIAFRWMLAFVFVVSGFIVGMVAMKMGSLLAAPPLVFAMFLLVVGVVLISPELIDWATAPIRSFVDHLFFPRTPLKPGPPDYTLARYYRQEKRYTEALDWYGRLLRAYPQELDAALEAMETAFESGDPVLARKIRKTALRKLRNEAARQDVWKRYASLLAEREDLETVADGNAVK